MAATDLPRRPRGRSRTSGPAAAVRRRPQPRQLVAVRGSQDLAGPVDVASRSGHATTEQLLQACVPATGSDARLVWVSESDLQAHGVEPWTQVPCWVPEAGEFAGFLEADTSRAARAGLVCRPVTDTVTDTWQWLEQEGMPAQRPDRDVHGLPTALEQRILASQ